MNKKFLTAAVLAAITYDAGDCRLCSTESIQGFAAGSLGV